MKQQGKTDYCGQAIKIGARLIGHGNRPFIIAEMSGNHNQSLERALDIVTAAAAAGADALKIQTYTADTMTLNLSDGDFFIDGEQSLWKGKSLYQLYREAYTPWEWHEPIFRRCRELGIIGFSTPFDETAVDYLESLSVPCYKVASFENIDLLLLRKIASTGKPIIVSTGMADLSELAEMVATIRHAGGRELVLLQCTSSYPAEPVNSNLLTIPHMRDLFGCQVGLSDHTRGIGAAIASVALGASVIEKHFTLARADGGVDAEFSLEPKELTDLVAETKRAWQSLGQIQYGPKPGEDASRQFRRSLYIVEDMKAGDSITNQQLRRIRPGFGLPPKYYEQILGRRVKQDVKKGTAVSWDLLI